MSKKRRTTTGEKVVRPIGNKESASYDAGIIQNSLGRCALSPPGLCHQVTGRHRIVIGAEEAARLELERAARLGLAGAMITEYPLKHRRYDQSEYEPFWAALKWMRTAATPLVPHPLLGTQPGWPRQ